MTFFPTISAQDTPISDAINSGDITTRFTSTGAASGHIANCVITNTGSSDITLDLQNSGLEGMVLQNPYEGEQDEVITDTPGVSTGPSSFTNADNVTLGPGESTTIPIIGYCMNFDLATPTDSITYDLATTSPKANINDITDVVNTLDDYEFPSDYSRTHTQDVTQVTIWASQPENEDTPLSDYTGRGYRIEQEDIAVIIDILNQSGIDTENIAALTAEPIDSEDGGLLGYPWGLPIGNIPCNFFILSLIALIIAIMLLSMRKAFKKPKEKTPPSRPPRGRYARPPPTTSVSKAKPENCDELIKKCKKAKAEAETAAKEVDSAKKKANDTYFDYQEAGEAVKDAEEGVAEAREKPTKEGSWVEMDGVRITSQDLKLRSDASKELWSQYRQGSIDAKTLERRWEELGEHQALQNLRKKDRNARIKKAMEKADQAREALEFAKLGAKNAKEAANSAIDKASKAKELANKLCKAADDCIKRVQAESAKVATTPSRIVTAKDTGEGFEGEPETVDKDSEETEETTEETTETTEETTGTTEETEEAPEESLDRKGKKDKKAGETGTEIPGTAVAKRPRTTYFGPRLGEPGLQPTRTRDPSTDQPQDDTGDKSDSTRTRPRTGDQTRTRGGQTETPPDETAVDTPPTAVVTEDEPKAPRCGPDVTEIYLKALNEIASRLRHDYRSEPGGAWTDFWGARAAYGISFLAANGMEMDFYVPTDDTCPTGKCQHTVTLLGECVVSHTLNDLIYGICAGFFGVPSFIQNAGGHFAEYISYGSLDPEVSQEIYRAGSELGEMVRDKPIGIGAGDLGVTVMKIKSIKKPECKPCPKPATGTIDGHDFTKHDWIWP